MAARLESRASAEQIVAAERHRWPSISAVVETKSSMSSASSRFLRIQQSLWDGGRKSAKIDEAKTLSDISMTNIELQRQDLFIQVVTVWQNLAGAQARIRVSESALKRLLAYQAQMTRRVDAQASPAIDLELINARLLQTQVELVTAKHSQQLALVQLEQLTVTTGLMHRVNLLETPPTVESTQSFVTALSGVNWESVAGESPGVAKARFEVTLSRNRLDAKRADKWPELYARVDQPIGSSNGAGNSKAAAFIGLNYAPGAGFASFSEEQAQAIRVDSQEQTLVSAVRSIQSTLLNDRLDFINARARIVSLDKSVSGSSLVLESYQRQFQAGRKTWQDLLNAVRELAQNEYAVAEAQAVMQGAMNRLEIRMGQNPHFP
jgi:adhesin transport system outer membrane protein